MRINHLQTDGLILLPVREASESYPSVGVSTRQAGATRQYPSVGVRGEYNG